MVAAENVGEERLSEQSPTDTKEREDAPRDAVSWVVNFAEDDGTSSCMLIICETHGMRSSSTDIAELVGVKMYDPECTADSEIMIH